MCIELMPKYLLVFLNTYPLMTHFNFLCYKYIIYKYIIYVTNILFSNAYISSPFMEF